MRNVLLIPLAVMAALLADCNLRRPPAAGIRQQSTAGQPTGTTQIYLRCICGRTPQAICVTLIRLLHVSLLLQRFLQQFGNDFIDTGLAFPGQRVDLRDQVAI